MTTAVAVEAGWVAWLARLGLGQHCWRIDEQRQIMLGVVERRFRRGRRLGPLVHLRELGQQGDGPVRVPVLGLLVAWLYMNWASWSRFGRNSGELLAAAPWSSVTSIGLGSYKKTR